MLKSLGKSLKEKLKGTDLSEIADIFLFGSAVKGKDFPKDIDICIVFKNHIIKKKVAEITNKLYEYAIHASCIGTDDFFRKPHPLAKTLLVEGVSILNGKPFIQNFGFSSYALYSYNLSKKKPSDKVKFVYLLKGRKEKGIVKRFGGLWIANSCFIIPVQRDSEMLIIFKKWEISYQRKEILIH